MLTQTQPIVNGRLWSGNPVIALSNNQAAVINRTYGLVEIHEAPNGIDESLGRLVSSIALADAIALVETLLAEQARIELVAEFDAYFARREAEDEVRHMFAPWNGNYRDVLPEWQREDYVGM